MKKVLSFLLTGVLLVSLMVGGVAEGAPEVIKIGVLLPLTGTATQAGVETQALLKLFEKAINETDIGINLPFHDVAGLPNLGGAKVEFVLGDLSTPDIAMAEAERLITEEKVIGLCGAFSSASTKTALVPAEKYGVILLSEGTSESLQEGGYKYYGRSYPGDGTFIRDSFEYLKHLNENGADIKTVALVSEDSEFGANIAKTEREWAAEYGFEVALDLSYSATASNVTSEVLRMKQADADVVMMSSYIADALLFMSTLKEQNYMPKMLFGQRGGFAASDFKGTLGADAQYVFSTSRWNTDLSSQVSKDMAAMYKADYSGGIDLIGDIVANAWNAYMLAIIANQAGSTDVEAMRAEMAKGIEIDADQNPTGIPGFKYGETGQNEFTTAIVVQYLNDGLSTVYPADVAAVDGVYPALGWSER